jgi:hypothetical protein
MDEYGRTDRPMDMLSCCFIRLHISGVYKERTTALVPEIMGLFVHYDGHSVYNLI